MISLSGAGLSTPEGLLLARQLFRPQLPHELRDFWLVFRVFHACNWQSFFGVGFPEHGPPSTQR